MEKTAEYGNWVTARLIVVPGVLAVSLAGAAVFVPALAAAAAAFLLISIYFAYARRAFSPKGRDIQRKVLDLVRSHAPDWDGNGEALEIGCGSGALTIQMAKRYPNARVVGVDMWGSGWGSSKDLCERNARIEGVAERVSFHSANAATLPFADGAFDMVASNMVFHEVHSVKDKRKLVEEAVRVLKPGGVFVFQDLFLWRRVYGPIDDLLDAIRSFGVESAEFVDTSRSSFVPKGLKLPFMLGTAGIVYGRK